MSLLNKIILGTVISFKTKNVSDPNTYTGKVEGFLSYELVRPYLDVEAYYESIVNVVGESGISPKENLQYFILKQIDTQEFIYLAIEWIDEDTLTIIENEGSLELTIINVTEDDINPIISILGSNGYIAVTTKYNEEVSY